MRSRRGAVIVLASVVGLTLTACAPVLQDPWGQAVSRGEAPAARPIPKSIQADLGVRANSAGAMPLTSRLYGEPSARYRLDVFGFFTPIAASWLWRDEAWTLVRHDTREVIQSTGNSIVLEGATPLIVPDVHAVFGFLWGNPLPGYRGEALETDSGGVFWTAGGIPWRGRFDQKTGLCLEASSAELTLKYGRHVMRRGVVIPGEVQVFLGTEKVLTIEVRDLVETPIWRKDPFTLIVPPGYDTLSPR
jgi:hypothetical protein